MRQLFRIGMSTGVLALLAATPATAQEMVDLKDWDQSKLYDGWSAEALFDTPVYGVEGEDIGEVENLIVDADGKVEAIVVEAGGVWDIGDTHFRVPWGDVEVGPAMERLTVPVDEDNVANFSLFDDEVVTGPQSYRATELIDDLVSLKDAPAYGRVDDLLFDREGQLQAVIVEPDVAYGIGVGRPYAYPYAYPAGYEPRGEYYELPYTRADIEDLQPFDYEKLDPDVLVVED